MQTGSGGRLGLSAPKVLWIFQVGGLACLFGFQSAYKVMGFIMAFHIQISLSFVLISHCSCLSPTLRPLPFPKCFPFLFSFPVCTFRLHTQRRRSICSSLAYFAQHSLWFCHSSCMAEQQSSVCMSHFEAYCCWSHRLLPSLGAVKSAAVSGSLAPLPQVGHQVFCFAALNVFKAFVCCWYRKYILYVGEMFQLLKARLITKISSYFLLVLCAIFITKLTV